MFKAFTDNIGGVLVELFGNVVTQVTGRPQDNFMGILFNPRKFEGHVSIENFLRLTGTPEEGVTINVLEHLFQDNKMGIAEPMFNRGGIKEFSKPYDLYVVFEKDNDRRIYVICHRLLQPLDRTVWEAGITDLLPTERAAKKPLAQHMDLSGIKPPDSSVEIRAGVKPEPAKEPEPVPTTAPMESDVTFEDAERIAAEQSGLVKPGNGHGKGKAKFVKPHQAEAQA